MHNGLVQTLNVALQVQEEYGFKKLHICRNPNKTMAALKGSKIKYLYQWWGVENS